MHCSCHIRAGQDVTWVKFDAIQQLCVMDGTYITAIRTAAAAVLSVRELARPDARVATLVGTGVQGREYLQLLPPCT